MPYQQPHGQPGPPGGYPYPASEKSRKGMSVALVAIGVVLLGVVAAAAVLLVVAKDAKDKSIAAQLAVGDCLADLPDSTLVSKVPKVACSEPHSGEVYAVLNMPDGDYPGPATIDAWRNKCQPDLQAYSPAAVAAGVGVLVLYPTADTWARGDRAITCIAATADKRTGSIKG